ncbi:MAG: PorT family protein [Cytophagales bacterium]|nr:PorT family protein [Cytophagales bacterium]
MRKLVLVGILLSTGLLAMGQTTTSSSSTPPSAAKPAGPINFLLKFGPQVSITDVVSTGNYGISSQGFGVRYFGGLGLDFHFKRNAAFTLGANYSLKRLGLNDGSNSSIYNLHYIQIPIGLKFVTDEITRDINLYFVGGLLGEVKVGESKIETSEMALLTTAFANNTKENALVFPLQAGFYLGAGVEWLVSPNNQLFAGLNYQRGFVNTINPFLKDASGNNLVNNLNVQSGIIQLEVGIKFL